MHSVQDAVEALESLWPTLLLEANHHDHMMHDVAQNKGTRPIGKRKDSVT